MDNMQPGQVISPGGQNDPPVPAPGAPEPERPEEPETTPTPSPTPPPEPVDEPPAPGPVVDTTTVPAEQANWQYSQDAETPSTPSAAPLPDNLSWTASEFVAHEKGASWYGWLALAAVAAAAVDYLLTKDWFSTGVILFAGVAFGAFAARKPHDQEYNIDHQGIWIGNKMYSFHDFKTFSVVEEAGAVSIVFMPLRRFMPPLTIYTTPDIEENVVDYLASFLPFEQHKADAIDNLLRRIRF